MPDALSRAYRASTKTVVKAASGQAVANWENLMLNGLSQIAIQVFTDTMGPAAIAAQMAMSNITSAFLGQRVGKKALAPEPRNVLSRNGSPDTTSEAVKLWAEQYARPFVEARSLVKNDGMSLEDAVHQTAVRVAAMVETDLQMSKLRQAHASLRHYGQTRYKRVTHPEESESGMSCPLCILASTRVYYVEELMPIHVRCNCDVDLLQPGDITIVNNKEYVGLSTLVIPEDLMTIGPRADPNSQRSILASYLQDIDKRQFEAITEAWAKTVEIEQHSEIGPVIKYKRSLVYSNETGLTTAQPSNVQRFDTKYENVVWTGPDVAEPQWVKYDKSGEVIDMNGDPDNTEFVDHSWQSAIDYDTNVQLMRDGARAAQLDGYPGYDAEVDAFYEAYHHAPWQQDNVEIAGKELVARAVHADPTDREYVRGIPMREADVKLLAEKGNEISLPLSSFSQDMISANAFATNSNHWTSANVPADAKTPVVFILEPGAKLAPVGQGYGQTGEMVGFGQFQIVDVKYPETMAEVLPPHGGDVYGGFRDKLVGDPVEITIRQTSMIEADPAFEAKASGKLAERVTPEYTIVKGMSEETLDAQIDRIEARIQESKAHLAIKYTDTADEAISKFEERWGILVEGMDDRGVYDSAFGEVAAKWTLEREQAAVNALRGVDEILGEHPKFAEYIGAVGADELPPGVSGITRYFPNDGYDIQKIEDVAYNITDIIHPSDAADLTESLVLQRFWNDGSEFYPSYSTMVHEMGHVLDIVSGSVTRDEAESILIDTWLKTQDLTEQQSENFLAWRKAENMGWYPDTPKEIAGARIASDFNLWLTDQFPTDAFHDYDVHRSAENYRQLSDHVGPFEVTLDESEAVAEAFQDVRLNGDLASDASKALHHALMERVKEFEERM